MSEKTSVDDPQGRPADDTAAGDRPADETPKTPTPRRFRLRAVVLPWVLFGLAAAALVWAVPTALEGQRLQDEASAEAAAETTTIELLRVLTNWDAEDPGLTETRDQLRELATGDFRDQIDELFGGAVASDLEASGARSSGEVTDVYVQSLEDGRAETFALVDQTMATSDSDQALDLTRRALVVLRRVDDGSWKVSTVSITDGIVPLTTPGSGG